jgi:cellulose synthase/poly-beta-1,6-N-acetylglucosamine synthase-like glycosyltransferase
VGNVLDPRDWERPGEAQIVAAATNRSLDPPGHVILLHDSGGDRNQTLRALPIVIDFYRSQGVSFTTVSGLLGQDRDFGMPPVRAADDFAVLFVAGGLNVFQFLENLLLFLLYVSIGIGVLRTVGLLALAIVQYVQRRPEPFQAQEIQPFVSVLVPAYNEEKVIKATIDSLLRSNYRNYEIIVIDDGSKDGTVAAARQYESNPRVRIIAKENGGKSSALNRGIQEARGEVVIAMDADTVFDPNFIPYILGHFRDPNVGAASGNAKVGNREDLIAQWQSIEYITSFNLDRRAYTLLNCVTVVPGAAGAWRKRDLIAAGGFKHDTLAEDADLTVSVRRLGRRIVYEDRALAWTEAPNNVQGFVKQRRRWSYGTLQMLTKHRDTLFRPRYGALGFVAFPSAVLYLTLALIAPAIDLGAIWSVVAQIAEDVQLNRETSMSPGALFLSLFWVEAPKPLLYYLAFILIEWVQSAISFFMDRERPWPLLWVPVQRFVLRWLLYYVLFATFLTALKGLRMGWGKLERKGTVLGSAGASRT